MKKTSAIFVTDTAPKGSKGKRNREIKKNTQIKRLPKMC